MLTLTPIKDEKKTEPRKNLNAILCSVNIRTYEQGKLILILISLSPVQIFETILYDFSHEHLRVGTVAKVRCVYTFEKG